MKNSSLFFLAVIIFVSILFNLFSNALNVVETLMFPCDFLFSNLYSKIESRSLTEDKLKSIMHIVEEEPFFIIESKEVKNLNMSIPWGIILKETNRTLTILTSGDKINENYLVVNENGVLLGFVEKVYSNNVLVRKVGWGNQRFFGRIHNLDVLIKENRGDILVEIPDDYRLPHDDLKLFLDFPFYLKNRNENEEAAFLVGDLVSKYGEFYLFKPYRNESFVVFIFPY
ncbi:MAG TPA: hypothetical protein PLO45_07500 [Defluviitoga sp.]|nr:hypothetical protein [Defluviitoga sp.]HOP25138.1 hypothetical protein [Defluviitoga sp.]HPZ28802.1 hypothetical protein [Defluviitoga sp.]